MEQLFDKINKAPLPVKIGALAGIVVVLTLLNFLLLVQPAEAAIAGQEAKLRDQNRILAEKKDYAQNLNDKRKELVDYEQRLQEALTQLPEQKDVEELLAQLNDVGKKSGLEISKVIPLPEAPSGDFLSRIPVRMEVSGNYHEIAMFLQEVSSMRRIVNVSGIALDLSSKKSEKVMLESSFVATAFRFVEPQAGAAPAGKGGKKAKGAK